MKKIVTFPDKRDPVHDEIQSYAVTRSLSREKKMAPGELRKFAAELMISISGECFSRGAKDIGHIKGHIKYDTGFLSADTLGSSEDVVVEGRDGEPTGQFTVVINSVVFGLSRKMIESATDESLDSVTSQFGLNEIRNEQKKVKVRKKEK